MTVGLTGTHKSAAMDVIKQAIKEAESAQGLSFQNSKINQCKKSRIEYNFFVLSKNTVIKILK